MKNSDILGTFPGVNLAYENEPLGNKSYKLKILLASKIAGRIYISFEGPKNYSFWVEPGKTVKEMEKGEYIYSFYAVGDIIEGTIKLKSTATLALKLIRGKLTINNKIGGNIYLSIDGPRDYSFWVPPGKSIKELVPGTYNFSYHAEDGYEKGTFTRKKSVLVMKIDKGKLRIQNKYPQNVFISFSGTVPYYLWIIPGRNILEMRTGTYKYQYYGDGKSHEGSINIPKKGNTLVLEPPKVCNCGGNQYNCSDFNYQSQAQACYNYSLGQVGKDVYRLDGDHDGRACEALP